MTRIAPRLKRVDINHESAFAGIWIDIDMNTPMSVFQDLALADQETRKRALARLVRSTNYEDENGNAVELHSPDGWNQVPPDFWNAVATHIVEVFSPPKASSTDSSTGSSGTTPQGSPTTTPA
jgi:hypothetical protein